MKTANNYPEMDVLWEIPGPRSGLDWMSREELRTILNARTRYPTLWLKNLDTKYINIRFDNRTGHALIWTQGFNSTMQVNREAALEKLTKKLTDLYESIPDDLVQCHTVKEAVRFLADLETDTLGVEPKKYWRLNPEWKDPLPIIEKPLEAARQFVDGKISAGKFGELLGFGPGELHGFKAACKALG